MAERYDDRDRGERGYARGERGFDDRVSDGIRPWFDEAEAERRRQAGEAERRREREAERLYRRDYGPYDYGWGSERRWRERDYGYPVGSKRRWTEPGWRDRDYEARRYGQGGETGHDTSWSGPSSSRDGQYTPQYLPWHDVTEGGDERWREGPFVGQRIVAEYLKIVETHAAEDVCSRVAAEPPAFEGDVTRAQRVSA